MSLSYYDIYYYVSERGKSTAEAVEMMQCHYVGMLKHEALEHIYWAKIMKTICVLDLM